MILSVTSGGRESVFVRARGLGDLRERMGGARDRRPFEGMSLILNDRELELN